MGCNVSLVASLCVKNRAFFVGLLHLADWYYFDCRVQRRLELDYSGIDN